MIKIPETIKISAYRRHTIIPRIPLRHDGMIIDMVKTLINDVILEKAKVPSFMGEVKQTIIWCTA